MSTTTRRGALRGASIAGLLSIPAIAATNTPPALAAGRSETQDPVIILYQRYRELEDTLSPVFGRTEAIRAGLVERWGEVIGRESALERWGHDPAYAELLRVGAETDRLSNAIFELTNKMVETPATTLAGIRAKMQVGLDVWPTGEDMADDYHETAALAFMKDALRLLDERGL
jgi:hypothetical protein